LFEITTAAYAGTHMNCARCHDTRWTCEEHPDKPSDHDGCEGAIHAVSGLQSVQSRHGSCTKSTARLNAMIEGFGSKYVEAHALEAKTAKKIPKRMIGRTLTLDKAAALLDKMA
jgi:hypothetical protein